VAVRVSPSCRQERAVVQSRWHARLLPAYRRAARRDAVRDRRRRHKVNDFSSSRSGSGSSRHRGSPSRAVPPAEEVPTESSTSASRSDANGAL
jgi:hypothetical protein